LNVYRENTLCKKREIKVKKNKNKERQRIYRTGKAQTERVRNVPTRERRNIVCVCLYRGNVESCK
jgi:hypothetical protein